MIRSRLPELGLLAVVVVWASTFIVTKEAFHEISPLAFAFVRFVGIAVLAFVVLAASKSSWRVARGDLARFAVAGVCAYCFYQLGFVLGLDRTSPFSSSLLIGTVPLFTIALLAAMGEQPSPQAWAGVGVALVGAMIFLADKLGAPESLLGDLLSLGSAMSFAIYGVVNRPLVKRYPTATYTAYTIAAGAIPLLLVSLPAAIQQDWRAVSIGSWLVVAYMILLPVYAAYIVWNWGIAHRGAAAASSYTLLVPVVSGLLSVTLYGEAFDLAKLVGAALVLAGLVLLQQRAARVPTMHAQKKDEELRSDPVAPG
jgi:drug/metabolite transporter (DMT)-like permease